MQRKTSDIKRKRFRKKKKENDKGYNESTKLSKKILFDDKISQTVVIFEYETTLKIIHDIEILIITQVKLRYHLFSTCAKHSENLTFLIPSYTYIWCALDTTKFLFFWMFCIPVIKWMISKQIIVMFGHPMKINKCWQF